MKKQILIFLTGLLCISMSSCYRRTFYDIQDFEPVLNLEHEEENQVTEVRLLGDVPPGTDIENLYNIHVLHTGVVGRFGCPVEIEADSLTSAQMVFYYNPNHMDNVPPENLILLHYNEEDAFYDTIPSELDTEQHTVTGDISEAGVYMLADAFQWYGVWGMDVSQYVHDNIYKDTDFCFQITIPQEIVYQPVSDYLKDDEEGRCQTILESYDYANDKMKIGIEYLERPGYASAEEFVNTLSGILGQNGYLKDTGKFMTTLKTTGYYFYSGFDEESFSINCIFPMTDTQYINVWYGFQDEIYFEKAMESLKSFAFYAEPNLPEAETNSQEEMVYDIDPAVSFENLIIDFPDDLTITPMDLPWRENENDASILEKPLCAVELSEPYQSYFGVDLWKNSITAKEDAEQLIQEVKNEAVSYWEYADSETIQRATGNSYLITMTDRNADAYYYLFDFMEIPDTDQYVFIRAILCMPEFSQEIYDTYLDCLRNADISI